MIKKIIAAVLVISLSLESNGFSQNLPLLPNPITGSFRPVHLRSLSYQPITDSFDVLFDRGNAAGRDVPVFSREADELVRYFKIGLRLPNSAFWVNLRPDSETQVIDASLAGTEVGRIMLDADLRLKKDTARFLSPRDPNGRIFWERFYKKANDLFGAEVSELPSFTRVWIVPGEIILCESAEGVYVCKALLKVVSEQDYLKGLPDTLAPDDRFRQLSVFANRQISELILPGLSVKINSSKEYAPLRQVFYSLILAQWCKHNIASSNSASVILSKIDSRDLDGLQSRKSWSARDYFNAYRKSCEQGEVVVEETVATSQGMEVRTYFSGGVNFLSLTVPAGAPPAYTALSDIPVSELDYLIKGKLGRDFVLDLPDAVHPRASRGHIIQADGGMVKKTYLVWLIPAVVALAGLFIPGIGFVYRAGSIISGSWGSVAAVSVPGVLSGAAPGAAAASVSLNTQAAVAPGSVYFAQTARQMIPSHGDAVYVSPDGMELTVGEGGVWSLHTSAHHGMDLAGGSAGSWNTASSREMLSAYGLDTGDFVSKSSAVHPVVADIIDSPPAVPAPPAVSGSDILAPAPSVDNFVTYVSEILSPVSSFVLANPVPVAIAIIAAACIAGYVIYRSNTSKARPRHASLIQNSLVLSGAETDNKIKRAFEAWNKILEGKSCLSDDDQKEILVLSKQLVNASALSSAVLKFHINTMASVQDRLAAQSLETIRLLKDQMSSRAYDEASIAKMKAVIRQLILVSAYSVEYRHALDFPQNLKLMSGYYMNPNHPLERSGLLKAVRLLWGIESETNRSKRLFSGQLRKIVETGNNIESHLYPDPEKNIRDFQKCADYFVEKVDDYKIGLDHEWRLRRMMSRILQLVVPFSPLLLFPILGIAGVPVPVSADKLMLSCLSGFGISIFIHRFFFYVGQNGNHYKEVKEILRTEESWLRDGFNAGEKPGGSPGPGDSMLEQEYARTLQALRVELHMTAPKTDVIVLVSENDPGRQEKLRVFVEGSRGKLIRRDVPVILVTSGGAGKTVEGVAGAFNAFGQDAWQQVQAQYPGLKNKPFSDVRAVCVMAGGSNFDKIFDALQFPAVPELDRPPSTIELALINGYRASQSLAHEGRFGVSLAFGDGALVGPIQRKGDITLVGTWASYRQMTDQGLGLILVDDYNSSRVQKFYEKIDLESVKNKLEVRSLSSTYDFNNKEKRQFLGLAGMIIFSFDDRQRYDSFAALLNQVSGFEKSAPQPSSPVKFIPDFLVPLIMKANGENIYTYLGVKLAQFNDDATRKFYSDLFDLYEKNAKVFYFRAYVPYHRELFYAKLDGEKAILLPELLTKTRSPRDGGKGGIDFRSLVREQSGNIPGFLPVPVNKRVIRARLVNILRQQELDAQPADVNLLQVLH